MARPDPADSNGVDSLSWTYDMAGRVLSETSTRNGTTLEYTYDALGNRLSLKRNGVVQATYTSDDAGRLETLTWTPSPGPLVCGFGTSGSGLALTLFGRATALRHVS